MGNTTSRQDTPSTIQVKRIGRTYAVVDANGVTLEGGFFGRQAAEDAAHEWRVFKRHLDREDEISGWGAAKR